MDNGENISPLLFAAGASYLHLAYSLPMDPRGKLESSWNCSLDSSPATEGQAKRQRKTIKHHHHMKPRKQKC